MKEEERVAFYRIHCFMDLQTCGITPLKFMGCGTRQRAYLEDDNWIGEYLNKPGFYKISHSMGDGNCFYWSFAQGLLDVEKNAVYGRFTLIPDEGEKYDKLEEKKEDKLTKLRQLAVGVRTVFANNIKLENYRRRAEPLNELRNFRHLRSLTRRIEAMMHPMKKVNKLLLLKTRESRLRHVLLKFDGIDWGKSLFIATQKNDVLQLSGKNNSKKRLLSVPSLARMQQINFWLLEDRKKFRAAVANFNRETFPEFYHPVFNDYLDIYSTSPPEISEKSELIKKLECFGLVDKKRRVFGSFTCLPTAEVLSCGEFGI